MSLTKRRLLFYCFILIFIILVPVVLLYATGYTINWRRGELQKTASLVIDSEPKEARIFLNGQEPITFSTSLLGTHPRTKTKLTGLVPGDYTVRLEQNGYFPWEEHISLQPGQVFNLQTVRLFRNSQPQLLRALPADAVVSAAPSHAKIAALSGTRLTVITIADNSAIETNIPEAINSEIAWSKNEDFLLVGQRFVVNGAGKVVADLHAQFKGITVTRWDMEDNNRLYVLSGKRLFRFTPESQRVDATYNASELIGNRTVADFRSRGNQLYLIASAGKTSELIITDFAFLDRTVRTNLGTGTFIFFNHPSGLPALFETTKRRLELIEEPLPLVFSYRLSPIADSLVQAAWRNDELVYTTPFEIKHWQPSGQTNLLARFGENVTSILPLNDSSYLAYTTGTDINVLPLQNEPFSQTPHLATFENIAALAAMDATKLYIVGRSDNAFGLFSLEIY